MAIGDSSRIGNSGNRVRQSVCIDLGPIRPEIQDDRIRVFSEGESCQEINVYGCLTPQLSCGRVQQLRAERASEDHPSAAAHVR
jgi:hypothetical protein